jgi:hypothetical protein
MANSLAILGMKERYYKKGEMSKIWEVPLLTFAQIGLSNHFVLAQIFG